MVTIEDLRLKAEQKINELIEGSITAPEASKWAEKTYFTETNKEIIESSPSLSNLFDSLIAASLTHDGEKEMYNRDSF